MKTIFILNLIFTNLLGGYARWAAYKETLFIGEPILLRLKYKNSEPKPIKVIIPDGAYHHNDFFVIFKSDTYKFWPGFDILSFPPRPDTVMVAPGESVYTLPNLFFWKDFIFSSFDRKKKSGW